MLNNDNNNTPSQVYPVPSAIRNRPRDTKDMTAVNWDEETPI